ncbi:ABC transporter substrate-binding protein [Amycolatopsis acidicola]|uniref:ABC transporter substrate-binding protein n=1 Tax=Amycolatopsis acidicola TaxID=2596893 RepID=A0A5N0V4L8_9PSEU|nr:ABC transporter substrate-binding protein [Amycolatopsis acidicola]KAA9160925.1 ABC transporter substrate-binding protein [Amycolatopsis acidicola]
MRDRWKLTLGASLAALLMAGCGTSGGSGAASGDTVRVMLVPGTIWGVPLQAAQDQGYFKAAGIDVSVDEVSGGMGANQLLASNTVEYGASSPSQALAAVQENQDVTIACGGNKFTPTALVAPAGSTLPSTKTGATADQVLQGLRGKTVGIPVAVGTGTANLLVETLAGAGLKTGDYSLINIGTGASAQAALTAKRVDAAMVVTPTVEPMLADGQVTELAYLSDSAPNYQLIGGVWQARRSWVEQHPKESAAFCSAMKQAYAYLQDPKNSSTVDGLVSDAVGKKTSAAGVAAIREHLTVLDADITADAMQKTIDGLTRAGVLKAQPPVTFAGAVKLSS